jgi:hypothetical protein
VTEPREITEHEAREWCRRHGFEFKSWDGTFCNYRDPRHAGTPLEFGLTVEQFDAITN